MKKYLLNLLKKHRNQKGFTLIEMVVVIAIIVLLLIIIAPNLTKQKKNAANRTDEAFKTTLQTQVELYENENHGHVPSFDDLRKGNYLTDDQFNKSKDYVINEDGEVKKK
ncbi:MULTISPECIES: competence type IV pilus major pilin ComGC [Lactobacillus]|uniref:Prepilin-type N-terminal cleavage/methylation domain-containing protein n=1 Tax=Lactobacillus xujianguonis TaxID=2495899 RepID=A0A437SW78_9LACO|nr:MULTISPECIES: competence type IV pilus major pilin ComGC [Lactobacillus]RVU71188.1 prepilin-type N-terminal cleavage/methylation domain-containing protein [Lactobacillus xujianguonis]RVU74131.1 prepilin-type N-terminal cleavage/methylation domain-containing protein [Lactobacillus xujianguonis]